MSECTVTDECEKYGQGIRPPLRKDHRDSPDCLDPPAAVPTGVPPPSDSSASPLVCVESNPEPLAAVVVHTRPFSSISEEWFHHWKRYYRLTLNGYNREIAHLEFKYKQRLQAISELEAKWREHRQERREVVAWWDKVKRQRRGSAAAGSESVPPLPPPPSEPPASPLVGVELNPGPPPPVPTFIALCLLHMDQCPQCYRPVAFAAMNEHLAKDGEGGRSCGGDGGRVDEGPHRAQRGLL